MPSGRKTQYDVMGLQHSDLPLARQTEIGAYAGWEKKTASVHHRDEPIKRICALHLSSRSCPLRVNLEICPSQQSFTHTHILPPSSASCPSSPLLFTIDSPRTSNRKCTHAWRHSKGKTFVASSCLKASFRPCKSPCEKEAESLDVPFKTPQS